MSLDRYIGSHHTDTPCAESSPSPETLLPGTTSRQIPKPSSESGLLLRCWNRSVWALPWSYFTEAQFEPDTPSELGPGTTSNAGTLRLIFSHREVTLRGYNLAELMEPIAKMLSHMA